MIKIQQKIADTYSMEQPAYTEAELIRYYGSHSLAFFGLSPENLHFLAPDGEGLVNYRLLNLDANATPLVLGDFLAGQSKRYTMLDPYHQTQFISPTEKGQLRTLCGSWH